MKHIKINHNKIVRVLLLLLAIQFIVYVAIPYMGFLGEIQYIVWRLFDMDEESSIPTWFSQTIFLLPVILAAWLAFVSDERKNKWYWGGISAIMLYLSIDDGAMLHEKIGTLGKYLVKSEGIFYYSWTIIGIIMVLIVGLVYTKFILRLPKKTRWLFILSGVVFLSGALGVEMYTSYIHYTTGGGAGNIIAGIEESLEVLGVVIFTYALFEHIKSLSKNKRIIAIEVSS